MLRVFLRSSFWVSPILLMSMLVACAPPSNQSQLSGDTRSGVAQVVEPVPANSALLGNDADQGSVRSNGASAEKPALTESSSPPEKETTSNRATATSKSTPAKKSAIATDHPIEQSPAARPSVPPNRLASTNPTFWATQRMAGFSENNEYFIYLESSRDTGAGIPKSALQLVEIASNRCITDGCIETRHGEASANLAIADTEHELLQQTWKVRQSLQLAPPVAGSPLPIVSRSQTADGTETMTVRLGNQSEPLRLQLLQKRVGSDDGTQPGDGAAMQLEVSYKGQRRSLGSLEQVRDAVLGYSVREVHLSPDGKAIAVLITATKPTFEGTLGTTLVMGTDLQ